MDRSDSQNTGNAVFDLPQALENAMGEIELLAELAEIFCDSCPTFLEQVDGAMASRDGEALRRAAHTLKGSLSPFCAGRAHAAAQRLEDLGKANDFAQAAAARQVVEREVSRLCTALGEFLVQPGG